MRSRRRGLERRCLRGRAPARSIATPVRVNRSGWVVPNRCSAAPSSKSYGDHTVLRGVDLSVLPGTIFALLGSNGAGKTTVVGILSTLLKADGGTAAVNGYDVATQPAKVRESFSLTGQFAAVDEILTGRENLVLIAQLRRLKNSGQIADDLLTRFALTDAGGQKAATYSGGMRRRLDIAMSLVGDGARGQY